MGHGQHRLAPEQATIVGPAIRRWRDSGRTVQELADLLRVDATRVTHWCSPQSSRAMGAKHVAELHEREVLTLAEARELLGVTLDPADIETMREVLRVLDTPDGAPDRDGVWWYLPAPTEAACPEWSLWHTRSHHGSMWAAPGAPATVDIGTRVEHMRGTWGPEVRR